MREKSFIAREEKLTELREICNRSDREPLMFLVELNTSQVIEFLGAFLRKCLQAMLPSSDKPDREIPVGAGWLMNKNHFVADDRMVEGNFAHEVKKCVGSAGSPVRAGGDALFVRL